MGRALSAVLIGGLLVTAACGGSPTMMPGPTGPTSSGLSATLTGTWSGSASDSTGSMMGGGFSPAMMNGVTWQITQAGGTFTGTMRMQGYQGGTMTVSGTTNGRTGTFTMTIPMGAMMMGGCTATASGTFDMDDVMVKMHGNYVGSNTCSGPFDHGDVSLTRQ